MVVVSLLSVAGAIAPTTPALALSPVIGYFDTIVAVDSSHGQILIGGWALTSDCPLCAIGIRITIDGAVFRWVDPGYILANSSRTDVGGAYPGFGDSHGFYAWVNAPIGVHQVCVQGQNNGVYNYLSNCWSYNLPVTGHGFVEYASPAHYVADGMPHTYGTTEATTSERSSMEATFNGRMSNWDLLTDITIQNTGYTAFTDAYWFVDPAANGVADTTCVNLLAGNVCEQARIRFKTSWATSTSTTSNGKRQGSCHEIGHSLGFDDSQPEIQSGCMSGGGIGEPSSHEIWHVNAKY